MGFGDLWKGLKKAVSSLGGKAINTALHGVMKNVVASVAASGLGNAGNLIAPAEAGGEYMTRKQAAINFIFAVTGKSLVQDTTEFNIDVSKPVTLEQLHAKAAGFIERVHSLVEMSDVDWKFLEQTMAHLEKQAIQDGGAYDSVVHSNLLIGLAGTDVHKAMNSDLADDVSTQAGGISESIRVLLDTLSTGVDANPATLLGTPVRLCFDEFSGTATFGNLSDGGRIIQNPKLAQPIVSDYGSTLPLTAEEREATEWTVEYAAHPVHPALANRAFYNTVDPNSFPPTFKVNMAADAPAPINGTYFNFLNALTVHYMGSLNNLSQAQLEDRLEHSLYVTPSLTTAQFPSGGGADNAPINAIGDRNLRLAAGGFRYPGGWTDIQASYNSQPVRFDIREGRDGIGATQDHTFYFAHGAGINGLGYRFTNTDPVDLSGTFRASISLKGDLPPGAFSAVYMIYDVDSCLTLRTVVPAQITSSTAGDISEKTHPYGCPSLTLTVTGDLELSNVKDFLIVPVPIFTTAAKDDLGNTRTFPVMYVMNEPNFGLANPAHNPDPHNGNQPTYTIYDDSDVHVRTIAHALDGWYYNTDAMSYLPAPPVFTDKFERMPFPVVPGSCLLPGVRVGHEGFFVKSYLPQKVQVTTVAMVNGNPVYKTMTVSSNRIGTTISTRGLEITTGPTEPFSGIPKLKQVILPITTTEFNAFKEELADLQAKSNGMYTINDLTVEDWARNGFQITQSGAQLSGGAVNPAAVMNGIVAIQAIKKIIAGTGEVDRDHVASHHPTTLKQIQRSLIA